MSGISGGDNLLKLLSAMDAGANNAESVETGWNDSNVHPESGINTATIAAWQEYGTKKIPARPFVAPARLEHQDDWSIGLGVELKKCLYNAELALEEVGQMIKKDLQQSILDVYSPPLAQETVDRKGFAKPLIDSSYMIDHIDVEVKK